MLESKALLASRDAADGASAGTAPGRSEILNHTARNVRGQTPEAVGSKNNGCCGPPLPEDKNRDSQRSSADKLDV